MRSLLHLSRLPPRLLMTFLPFLALVPTPAPAPKKYFGPRHRVKCHVATALTLAPSKMYRIGFRPAHFIPKAIHLTSRFPAFNFFSCHTKCYNTPQQYNVSLVSGWNICDAQCPGRVQRHPHRQNCLKANWVNGPD